MFKAKKQEVQFFAESVHLGAFPHPCPAAKSMPNYFLRQKPQITSDPSKSTVKRCIPFMEAMSQGYIIPMWSDVFVAAEGGKITLQFPKGIPLRTSLSEHGYIQIKEHPLSNDPYGKMPMKWHNPWGVSTPKGWSCLFTAPLNHLETRFKILDGVVDTDTYYSQVNFPFIWTGGDGEFFIPRGTPLVQVIPFKRRQTTHSVVVQDSEKEQSVRGVINSFLRYGYKKAFWHKGKDQ